MLKSVFVTACTILWLTVSAQIHTTKKVLSFRSIEAINDVPTDTKGTNFAPFKLVGGLMFVNGEFNGERETFILDTGAPGLILNQVLSEEKIDESYIASGLTGNASIGELTVKEFKVLDIVKSDFMAYQMDLEHIEDEILHRFSGLLGSDIFAQSTLLLDYNNQIWGTIESIDAKEVETVIPFKMKDHFIIVEIKVSGEKYNMILDTGAEINIISQEIASSIKKSRLKISGTTNIQSASRDHHSSDNVKLQRFQMGKHVEKNQEFAILPFDFINEGLDIKLDGLIGYPFFKDKKLVLDFKSGLLYLYK